ncbi:MAG TPA: hypothetical protein VG389_17520 [Myxococcota bacterium]|jgi:hypothetical protein|nr:hypothetical protein [Myxococcota bacterium]
MTKMGIAVAGSMLAVVLFSFGCPPSEGTGGPGTATGTGATTAEVGGAGTAAMTAAPDMAAAGTPDATVMADCMSVTAKVFTECVPEAAAMSVESRIKMGMLPADAAEKVKTPDGKKAVIDAAIAEMKKDMGDAAKNTAFCTAMATKMADTMKADHDALAACMAKASCAERVACFAPISEKHMKEINEKMGDMMKHDDAAGAPPAGGTAGAAPAPGSAK